MFRPVTIIALLTVLLSSTFPSCIQLIASEASRPNIVVFLSDDHTWRDSSVYGSPDIDTPNMARLAAAGMTFNQAFVASPSCAPSRAAMLTGMYPARNGAEPNHSRPAADIKKLPAYLQELGYEVVSFGKVGHYRQTPEYGFDIARHVGYHEDIAIPEALKWLSERDSDQRPVTMRSTIDRWMVQTSDPQAVFGRPKYRAADGRPNILTVFIDDMGWSDLWSILAGEDLSMSSP